MEKNLKVLMVINKFGSGKGIGGAERLVVDDINEMVKRKIDVRLLTLSPESKFSLASELNLNKDYWEMIHVKNIWSISGIIKVARFLKKERPDVIFSHLWFSNVVLGPISHFLKIKLITFEHNVYDDIKTKKMYLADRFIQNFSHKVVAVSSAVRNSLISHGIKKEKIVVINNGILIEKYDIQKDGSLKERLGLQSDLFVFISIGRLIQQKGMDILIKAFSKLNEKNTHLLIVGDGNDRDFLEKLAGSCGVKDRVHFLGVRLDIPELLSISDCFVLASRYEGLGIVVLEAMASKAPVIISDFEAGKDIIINNISGLVVKKEDISGLSGAMENIYRSADFREKLAKGGYTRVQAFSIQNHVNNIMSL